MRIHVRNNLSGIHPTNESPVYHLVSSKLHLQKQFSLPYPETKALWSSEWWGLNDSKVFCKMHPVLQGQVLEACNKTLLNEAYFVEKSGLAYCSKMVLLSTSTDVAQLYALIGADEAKHLAWIEPYVAEQDKTRPTGQFLDFLSTLIEDLSPNLLVYLVQIVLEGWGLDHYRRLETGCQDPNLASVLSNILKDEALHHRAGALLFDPSLLTAHDLSLVRQSLEIYSEMVRIGPLAAISAVDRAAGGLSLHEIEEVVIALKHLQQTAGKLALLKSLMYQQGIESIVDRLEQLSYFQLLTAAQVARTYLSHRGEMKSIASPC